MSKISLKFDRRITLKVPFNGISQEGVKMIVNHLYQIGAPKLPAAFDWVWKTDRGTLPKRIASALYNSPEKYKISDSVMANIGSIASSTTDKRERFCFDFTKNLDWQHGEFGDSGSCFWTTKERIPARKMIAQFGFAMRFFVEHSPKGYARCFAADVSEQIGLEPASAFVLFNAYGIELLVAARLMAMYFGMSYRTIALFNNGSSTQGTLYINNGHGQLVCAVENIEKLSGRESVDLGWKDLGRICLTCNAQVNLSSEPRRLSPQGALLCVSCFDRSYFQCYVCEKPSVLSDKLIGELREDEGERAFCVSCVEANNVISCCICGKTRRNSDCLMLLEGKVNQRYCRWCRHKVSSCRQCGLVDLIERLVVGKIDGVLRCPKCNDCCIKNNEIKDKAIRGVVRKKQIDSVVFGLQPEGSVYMMDETAERI